MTDFGFIHNGVFIEDVSLSPCGRFQHTTQQAIDTYAPTINKIAKSQSFTDLDSLCLFVQNCIGITDGGNASIFWSGYDNGIMPDDYILEYICNEIANHLGFDDGFMSLP